MSDAAGTNPAGSHPGNERGPLAALSPLLERLRDSCILLGHDMRVLSLNGAARRKVSAHGDDPERFPGNFLWDLFQHGADDPARRAIEQVARDGVPHQFTSRASVGGYAIEADAIPVDQGILVYYRDLGTPDTAEDARARSERELRMTSERLRTLIDDAPLAIIVLDAAGNVLHWNPQAEVMFQWTAGEVVGGPQPNIPDEERDAVVAQATLAYAGGSLKAIPGRRRRKDGVVLDVQLSSSPMRDGTGAVTGAIVMLTDVTANRKLETQLRMAQKMEAVGLLAGGVAHDFNNLLTAIKGFAALLEMTVAEDEQSMEFLGEINKAADRAASLTAQLLAFSRRQLLRPEPLDLNARVRDLERMLRLLVRDDAQLVLDLDAKLNQVLADPGQIEQVILNLIVNARDAIHGRPGGVVTIATSNAELSDEFAQWGVQGSPGSYVRLDVADNGIGMDRATQARIFDPFFTTKEPGQGTGLGLAMVFGIVKQSGGYVWVKSRPGEGAVFTIYLPRATSLTRRSGAVNVIGGGGRERVLLAEDEDSVRRVARRALELHGYSVIEAPDGETALALAEIHEFDMLLTDVMMPGMRGPQLAELVRRKYPDVPVLFMSGLIDEIVREGLLDPGTPFLAKPFTPAQLAARVRDALDRTSH